MIFNQKYDVVARHHLVYDVANAEKYHQWAVLTVEKNRFGQDGINLSSASTSTRAASRPTAAWSPSSWSTTASSRSDSSPRDDDGPELALGAVVVRRAGRGPGRSVLAVALGRDVARAVGVDLDAGPMVRGDGDLPDVAALGAGRLEPEHLLERRA
jgi:hypothetical protein